jgi:uncharacterized protein (TIGR00304 family)
MVDLVLLGIVAVILGFAIIFLASILGKSTKEKEDQERKVEVKGGGVVLIGPIPIIFGSDAKWATIMIILAIILVVISFFFFMQYRI